MRLYRTLLRFLYFDICIDVRSHCCVVFALYSCNDTVKCVLLCCINWLILTLLPPCFIDAGGGSSYNWMTPSLQSLDPSFTMGTGGGTQSSSTSASESALLFSKMMRPPKRPLRAIRPGEGFGTERLKPDETASLG